MLYHKLTGRLGNQLFQWASTTGIAASNAMGTCFTGLQDIGVFFEVNPEDFKCTDAKPEKSIGEGAKYVTYNEFQFMRTSFCSDTCSLSNTLINI